jgi:hypothetical protein
VLSENFTAHANCDLSKTKLTKTKVRTIPRYTYCSQLSGVETIGTSLGENGSSLSLLIYMYPLRVG